MKISYRQLSILVFMSFISLKLLELPSLIYIESENMGWFVILVLMLIDFVYALLILSLLKRNQNKNLYEFMKECLGVVLTKIILFLLLLRFALYIANLLKSMELFVVENFYNEFEWYLFILPLICLVGFMVYKGIRNIGRVGEMFCWAIIIGVLYIVFKSIASVDLFEFLPMFKDGVGPLISGGFKNIEWFGSPLFMIPLFGKVDLKDEKKLRFILYMLGAIVICQLVLFVFYGLFGKTSPTLPFALSNVSQFSSGLVSRDEISWLVVSLWVVMQVIVVAIYGYGFCMMLKYLFNIRNSTLPVFILNVLMFLWPLFGELLIHQEKLFLSKFISIFSICIQYLVPVILWIGYLMKNLNKKNKAVKYEQIKINI